MYWLLLATESTVSTPGALASILAAIATTGGGVFAWFRKELDDCKSDRKALFQRVEELHTQVSELSMRVGRVEEFKIKVQ